MYEFIIDINVDVKASDTKYPAYFFDDLMSNKSITLVVGGTKYYEEIQKKFALWS